MLFCALPILSYRYLEGGDGSDARPFGRLGGGVPAKPTEDAVDTETIYKMSRAPRGIAVIINNKNFVSSTGMDPRHGTDVDREALERLFKSLKFEVRIYEIRKIADYDAFIFSILTHGKEGLLYGTDGTISLRDLTSAFKDATSLAGKLKMFFFQACQGKKSLVPCNVHLISFALPLSLSRSCVNWFAFVLFHWKLFDIQVKGCLSGSVEGVKSNINDDNNKKVVIMMRKRLIIYATSGKSVQFLLRLGRPQLKVNSLVGESICVVECKSVRSKIVSIDRSRFDRRKESVRSKTVTLA